MKKRYLKVLDKGLVFKPSEFIAFTTYGQPIDRGEIYLFGKRFVTYRKQETNLQYWVLINHINYYFANKLKKAFDKDTKINYMGCFRPYVVYYTL